MGHDSSLPPLFDRHHALAAGLTRHQVANRVRTGAWLVLRRGIYVLRQDFEGLPERERHLLRLVATLRTRGEHDVASHLSAATVHGWGLPYTGPGPVTITSGDLRRSARRRSTLVVQVATLPPSDVTVGHVTAADRTWELATASRPRTLADCLRHLPPEDSVAIGDAVLRSGQVTPQQVSRVLDRQEPWPYLARGRLAFSLLDPRRESYLESFSFVRLWQHGVPLPQPQVSIYDDGGRFVARVDGWIAGAAIALEADGAEKYLLPEAGEQPAEAATALEIARRVRRAVAAQAAREHRLQQLGVTVVRWGTADALHRPHALAARIRSAERASAGRFTGTAVPKPSPAGLSPQSPRPRRANVSAAQAGFSTVKPA